ncbi:MAG: S9 family peptidase [Paucibacter sp.]|nr:S9 family peptidase [Roseateles sp.]
MAARKTALKPFDVEALWELDRIGVPSLSPDGAQAVASVTRYSMADNRGASSLWLFSTLGGEPRRLTFAGDKDGQPQWSPMGDQIAFIARREQQGEKDEEPQLYLIAPDGGEARAVAPVATGIEAFKWFPDGKRIAFISWVWPELKGAAAQARAMKEFRARKESGYVTSEASYRWWDRSLPMGRVPHLHVLDLASGKVRDLFEGRDLELTRRDPDANCFDISPDGRRIVFSFDPAAEKRCDDRFALGEIEVRAGGRHRTLLLDKDWDFSAPRYSHGGSHLAFLASHQGLKSTMPTQLAVLDQKGRWAVFSEAWDQAVNAPLLWTEDDEAVLFNAEEKGRRHLWRFDLALRQADVVFEGGNATSFAAGAGVVVVNHDRLTHPPRLSALVGDVQPQRMESFNDELLARHRFGPHEETWIKGAQGDPVQLWLNYPPGFDPKKKFPLLHLIHGGPHTAFGDSWHWRWNHQVFAAQGYVVASVNYHGSSSFGYAFLDSITHRWGELELQDVQAATSALLRKPWADRKRVFAAGGSYGGYMAAWMNGHVKPGRYAAYICHAGCFDWQAMFADDCYSGHARELGAWYWDDPAKIAAQSPHAFARHMKTPTLVIHGAQDYRVPDAQGLAYYNTLKARGVDARLLWFPDENHWVLKPRNSRLWYGEFFSWLRRHGGAG